MALFSGGLLQTPLPHTADQIHSSETFPTTTRGRRKGREKKKKKSTQKALLSQVNTISSTLPIKRIKAIICCGELTGCLKS